MELKRVHMLGMALAVVRTTRARFAREGESGGGMCIAFAEASHDGTQGQPERRVTAVDGGAR